MRKLLQLLVVVLIFLIATGAAAGPLEEVLFQEIPRKGNENCCWREVLMDITVGTSDGMFSEEDFLRLAPSCPALSSEAARIFFEGQLKVSRRLYEEARKTGNKADKDFFGAVIEGIQKTLGFISVGEEERNEAKESLGPVQGKTQYRLGWKYKTGQDVPRDPKKAFHWFEKAATQGHPKAQFETGKCYEFGEGVQEDGAKAAQWFEKAAMQGHEEAPFYLGGLYWFEDGPGRDEQKALNWWFIGAARGEPDSQHNLAAYYFEQAKVDPAGFDKAYYWYRQAAEGGLPGDLYMVGLLSENGWGVRKDIQA
ncbi:MAG: tetratricopeptide repeat protein, partial [Thermovirgaceae bacterium]